MNENPVLTYVILPAILIGIMCIGLIIYLYMSHRKYMDIIKKEEDRIKNLRARAEQVSKKYHKPAAFNICYNDIGFFELNIMDSEHTNESKKISIHFRNVMGIDYKPEDNVAILTALENNKVKKYYLLIGEERTNYLNNLLAELKDKPIVRMTVEQQQQAINSMVNSMQIETKPKKDASVVGRAVAGGILAGGTGAIVGALSAMDENNKNRK